MNVIACPTDVVSATPATIWGLLTNPEELERWAGVTLIKATPAGPAQAGQLIEFRTRELARSWRVTFVINEVNPPASFTLDVHLPFRIVNHEHIVLTPVDDRRTRVTFN
jgi:hypothetical protein